MLVCQKCFYHLLRGPLQSCSDNSVATAWVQTCLVLTIITASEQFKVHKNHTYHSCVCVQTDVPR